MKTRKYSFTLMEVMIGFSIMSIVLGVIFSSLYQETLLKTKIGKMEKTVMARVEMQQRLDRIFANIIPMDPRETKRTLYTSGGNRKTLYITFDNGIDPDPEFCDQVKGSLSLERRNFVLKLNIGEPNERTSILRENVDDISLEFLTNATNGIGTFPFWDKAINFSPSYIKITLRIDKTNLDKDEEYVFWVNRPSEGIPLRGEK